MTTVDATISGPDDFSFELGGGLMGDASRAVTVFCRAVKEGRASGTCEMSQAGGVMSGEVVLEILGAVSSAKWKREGKWEYLNPADLTSLVDPDETYRFSSVEF